jgi:hypothetical protein
MSLELTLAVMAVLGAICAFGSWRAARPADPLKPRMIPWRPIILVTGAAFLLVALHLTRLLGVTTEQPYR